ncbi:MAG: UbiA family prenyltransferase [Candidatus Hodarchaeales archaeon]|jgi:geranylgeranylglycerol-phosphate geranylgeranyltransferase
MIQFRAIIDLFRFTLGILGSFAVLSAGFIVYVLEGRSPNFLTFFFDNGVLEWPGLMLGLFAVMLLTWGNQSVNDLFDVETDIANQRFDRPLARGDLSRNFVKILTFLMFFTAVLIIGALVLIYRITIALFIFTLIFIIIGVGYNFGVKQLGFIGNIWVSLGYVAPLFMGFFMLNPQKPLTIGACGIILNSTFYMSIGREVIKDIQDYEGDKQQHLNSLAVKYGPRKASIVATIFFCVTILSSVMAGVFVYKNLVFWFFDAVFAMLLLVTSYTIFQESTQGGKKARKYTRWSLWVALAAFFFGIFFLPP